MADELAEPVVVLEQGRTAVPRHLRDVIGNPPVDRATLVRYAVYAVSGVLAVGALAVCVLTFNGSMPWHERYYTDFLLLGVCVGLIPYAVFYLREVRRMSAIDEKFPDFLRDLAESARGGMTLPRALASASKGRYGRLDVEIAKMAAQVEWGVGFTDALERFAQRNASPLVRRTVSLIIEARHAGGNVVDVLTAASEDAREIKQLVAQRQNTMRSYSAVIYITFLVFVAVVLILQAQLVPAFQDASESAGGTVNVGAVSFKNVDEEAYGTMFFHAAIIQAVTGGLVGGVLTKGNPVAGLGAIIVMLVVCEVCFRLLGPLL